MLACSGTADPGSESGGAEETRKGEGQKELPVGEAVVAGHLSRLLLAADHSTTERRHWCGR